MLLGYKPFSSDAEINGDTIQAVIAALHVPEQAQQLLVKHGLPAAPQRGSWYPAASWYALLTELEQAYGGQTLYATGLQVIHTSQWPPNLHTMHEALHALDQAYRANMRGADIGYYRVEGIGPREIRVVCWTPNPMEFDCGIVTGLVRKFKPMGALRVRVDTKELPATVSAPMKHFRVSW
jgi:hypothetical protein